MKDQLNHNVIIIIIKVNEKEINNYDKLQYITKY